MLAINVLYDVLKTALKVFDMGSKRDYLQFDTLKYNPTLGNGCCFR